MRPSFRSALLLGSAIVALAASSARADDPLIPEGAERPKMGKELVLPPIINEAPPNTEIVLPPPGQEHLLGARPANAVAAAKTEERAEGEPVAEVKAAANATKPAKKKRKVRGETQTAKVETAPVAAPAPEKALYAGVKTTAVPEQSDIVSEDAASPAGQKIVETNARMADLTKPAMGGPELSGPPSVSDGMSKTDAPIRDGDAIDTRRADALTKPAANPDFKPENAPAIQRFEIAQASSSPMPVTPAKAMNQTQPDWDIEFSGGVGYGRVETSPQSYFGTISDNGGSVSGLGAFVGVVADDIKTDDEDDVITYEAAARFNLTGHVEPLGGGKNVEPYVKVGVSGYDAEYATRVASHSGAEGDAIFVPGVGGNDYENGYGPKKLAAISGHGGYGNGYGGNYAFWSIDDINYVGDENVIRGLLEYGQTWHGSTGMEATGFAQIAHTRREFRHTLTFTGNGLLRDRGEWDEGGENGYDLSVQDEDSGYDGKYDTEIDTNTTSFGLGVGIAVPLTKDRRLKADASVRGSYDITTAEGRDSLVVVDNDDDVVIGASSTRLSKTNESFGYGAGVGVSYEIGSGVGIRLGAEYTSQEAVPVVIRDGVNPSRLELEREDVLIGKLTATIKF